MPENEDLEPGEEQNQEPTFAEKIGRVAGHRMYQGDFAGADAIRNSILSPQDLLEPGFNELVEGISDDLRADLTGIRDGLIAEQEAHQLNIKVDEQRRLDEEARKVVAEEREKAERDEALNRAIERARAEQVAATVQELVFDATEPFNEIIAEVDELRKTPTPEYDAKARAFELKMAPVWRLADTMGNPSISPAARVDEWERADPETRGLVSKLGIAAPFDLDVDSPEYRKQLDAFQKEKSDTERWVAEQTERGRS